MDAQHIRRIAVVGAGTMGHGIAMEFALAGYQVRLHSRTEASLDRALRSIRDSLDLLTSLGVVTREEAGSVPARLQTGKGFYEWMPRSAEALKRRIAAALVEIERWPT